MLEGHQLQPFLNWLSQHTAWAGLVVFTISLLESLAGIGIVIPGLALMGSIGWLIGTGVLPLFSTLTWAALGAIVGDSLSYGLGYYFYERLRSTWPFTRYPHWLSNGERFFQRHGGKSVILGRFVGPIRPMIPVIAGMMDMPPRRFFMANVFSGIAWAPIYTLPGILIGSSLGHVNKHVLTHLSLFILFALITGWLGSKLIQFSFRKTAQQIQTRLKLESLYKAQQFSALFIAIFISFLLLTQVLTEGSLTHLNAPIFHFLQCLHAPHLDQWMQMASHAGHAPMLASFLVIIAYLTWQKQTWTAAHGFFLMAWGETLTFFLKQGIAYPRPLAYLTHNAAFPSGHTTRTTLLLAFIAYLLQKDASKEVKNALTGTILALISLVAFSRLYLGYHWLTDILGALSLSATGLLVMALSYERKNDLSPINKKALIGILLVTLTLGTTLKATFSKAPPTQHLPATYCQKAFVGPPPAK